MTTTTLLLTRSIRLLGTLATRIIVVTLAIGSCQLAVANASIDRARHINCGSSRTGNRLSACRLEPPVWELGVSQGSPPRDLLEASTDAVSPSQSSVPDWAAIASERFLARLHRASPLVSTTSVVAPATTAIAAVPVRGPPAL